MSNLKKIIIAVAIFLIVCVGLALKYNDLVSLNNPKYYKQAVVFFAKQDYQNAYYNFGKVKKISPLYVAALFKQGVCAEKLGDYDTAIKKYNLLLEKSPKSFFAPRARYSLAKAYFQHKDYDDAERLFKQIKNQGVVEDYIIASNYYLGLLNKKTNPEVAKKYFFEYIKLSPKGTFSVASSDELGSMPNLTEFENRLIGSINIEDKNYVKAKPFLEKSKLGYVWADLATCYWAEGDYKKAKIIIEQGLKFYSKNVDKGDLRRIIDIYSSIYSNEAKTGLFKLSKIIDESDAQGEDYVYYKLAKILGGKESLNLYSKIAYKYPNSDLADVALWNLFWNEYQHKNYKKAKQLGSEHLKRYPESDLNARMLFWMGKVALKQKKSAEANGYWNKILSRYPDDYYAFRADALAKGDVNEWGTKKYHKLLDREVNVEFPINYSELDIKDLKLINTLLELGDYEVWSELNFNNKFVESWFEYKRGNKSKSVLLAREALISMDVKPPFNDDIYKLAYPLYYVADVNKNATSTALDPYLIMSLIREESYFNSTAKSKTGAVGLMQLMPSTASYVATKYGYLRPSVSTLLIPEKNIIYGCLYFKYIKNALRGNDVLSVIAYNGGPNAVNQWSKNIKYTDYDEFVENIPYSETRNYIKKVYRTYWNYLNVYNY
ncbi:MAG: transglycosylase SLT domain-containing protein [Candidatus Gastranaerophilales bacterium]|nr:transglycosylase SLT domain-containing protein [Candidatus Gastranaerophilales bacterium]